jgi:hypothetical protein
MSIMGSIKHKNEFGETAGIFEGIDEGFLQEKLNESIHKMTDFFENMKAAPEAPPFSDSTDGGGGGTDSTIPNPEKLFEHLQSLFGGKIGGLAKEFAEEFAGDMKDILNEDDLRDAKSVKDILPKLLKDPKKIMSLVKSIQEKVNHKMESGEITRDEMMRETNEMMEKMREMGGVDNFADMLKGMADKMGMGGKNMRIDKNALRKMESDMKMRDEMRRKLELRKSQIVKNEKTGEMDFVVAGAEKQEKSYLEQKAEIDKLMDDLKLDAGGVVGKKGKPKGKKNKK